MSEILNKPSLSRREFLRVGGLTAVTLARVGPIIEWLSGEGEPMTPEEAAEEWFKLFGVPVEVGDGIDNLQIGGGFFDFKNTLVMKVNDADELETVVDGVNFLRQLNENGAGDRGLDMFLPDLITKKDYKWFGATVAAHGEEIMPLIVEVAGEILLDDYVSNKLAGPYYLTDREVIFGQHVVELVGVDEFRGLPRGSFAKNFPIAIDTRHFFEGYPIIFES